MYRDYDLDTEDGVRFYYVMCKCGLALLDGKWQYPSRDMREARRVEPGLINTPEYFK